ncbi:MAG: RNA polymerase subunit sigma-70 [Clostridia bacterium]|nr:RNA polymerase subunit sigma-70 [Clostridia bacterium]
MTNEQKEKIIRFRNMGHGYAEIGREIGVSKDTVKSYCRRNGLKISDSKNVDKCRECSKPIMQYEKKKKRIFCCKACREKWWAAHPEQVNKKAIYSFECTFCGRKFTAYGNSKRKYCSHKCYIKDRFGGRADE